MVVILTSGVAAFFSTHESGPHYKGLLCSAAPRHIYTLPTPGGLICDFGKEAWRANLQNEDNGASSVVYGWKQNLGDAEAIERIATREEALALAELIPAGDAVIRRWLSTLPDTEADKAAKDWYDAL